MPPSPCASNNPPAISSPSWKPIAGSLSFPSIPCTHLLASDEAIPITMGFFALGELGKASRVLGKVALLICCINRHAALKVIQSKGHKIKIIFPGPHRRYQPALAFTSSPESKAKSSSLRIRALGSSALGQVKRPFSKRLAQTQSPLPSQNNTFTRLRSWLVNTNQCPESGSACRTDCRRL